MNRNRNKMKQKINKIQELILVHRNYYGLISPKIKQIKPIKEIAVPQTSLILKNLRTTTSHTDSVDRHFDFI